MRASLLKSLHTTVSRGVARRGVVSKAVGSKLLQQSSRSFASAGAAGNMLADLTKENPHVDVVRYEHKNQKWSLKQVEYYSEAVAIGFLETGLRPGDVLLSWLPSHFSESMILQFACSKAGFVYYQLDPKLAITDQETSKKALEQALTLSKANILVSQDAADDVNYAHLVEDIIPDLDLFDTSFGAPFVCPQFPHLRFPIHTGFDRKFGWFSIRDMIVPSENLDEHLAGYTLNGATPLLGEFKLGSDGVPTGLAKTMTNDEVVKSGAWPTFSSILKKEYHEVEGVGVVW